MDTKKTPPFCYSGSLHFEPQELLKDAIDGLATAQHMLSDPHALPPTERALEGLYNLLGDVIGTLESAERLFQERITDPYGAGFADGRSARGTLSPKPAGAIPEHEGQRRVAAE